MWNSCVEVTVLNFSFTIIRHWNNEFTYNLQNIVMFHKCPMQSHDSNGGNDEQKYRVTESVIGCFGAVI